MRLFLGAVRAQCIQTLVRVTQGLDQVDVRIALVVGAFGDLLGQFGQLRFQLVDFFKSLHGHVDDAQRIVVFHFLGQVTNAILLGGIDAALGGDLNPGNDLQKR